MRNITLFIVLMLIAVTACNSPKEHTAAAINPRDSVPMMTSFGVNTLISDSGVMKYRIVAERWEVNENVNPPRWIFRRGIFLEQFDEKFHVEAYIQSDTAYYFTSQNLWHLIGNVRVRTLEGVRFFSEELYWDQNTHELYSNVFSHLITPTREMQGTRFRSNEQMTKYNITNSKGSFTQSDVTGEDNKSDSAASAAPIRQPAEPFRRSY